MHTRCASLLAFLWLLICGGCMGTGGQAKTDRLPTLQTLTHVEGEVDFLQGEKASIKIKLPEVDTSAMPFTNRIAQKVIQKTFLLENSSTTINGEKAAVTDIRGDSITVEFEAPSKLSQNDRVRIYVPKKVIGITDFEVIRGHEKAIGLISMESLTTAMVNSGQFIVVERNKLEAVLKELKIGLLGLTDKRKVKQLGELIQADLILTGTLANLGSYWNVNLRLINVSTGIIVAAFEEKEYFEEIKPEAVKDVSDIDANFEDPLNPHDFTIGESIQRNGAHRNVYRDDEQGANNTSSSICMAYRLPENGPAVLWNQKKRDLSMFSGVTFFAKADHEMVAFFMIRESNREDQTKIDAWRSIFPVDTSWNEYRIDFKNLGLSPEYARMVPGGDGILSLDLTETIIFGVSTGQNLAGSSGKIWIDEIHFY